MELYLGFWNANIVMCLYVSYLSLRVCGWWNVFFVYIFSALFVKSHQIEQIKLAMKVSENVVIELSFARYKILSKI